MPIKPSWMFTQAGALPYLWEDGVLRVVLITSRTSGKWIFPKGVIDPGETPESTACIEAREEAGVVGEVRGLSLGFFEAEKWGGVARIEVFPLNVETILDAWDEQASRERVVIPIEEAKSLVDPDLVRILDSFQGVLAAGDLDGK